jgi:hypothetical protein
MKKLITAFVLCTAGLALAAGEMKAAPPAAAPAKDAKAGEMKPAADAKAGEMKAPEGAADPMAMWKPKKATKKDDKAIDAACKGMQDAMMKGDLEAASSYVDFPVLMITDNTAGQASSTSMTKDQWMATMKPAMDGMAKMKDAKMSDKHKTDWLTDSLCFVHSDHTMTMGKNKMEWSAGTLMIQKDGKWLMKAMAEGGWGDVMGQKGAAMPAAPTGTTTATK